MKTYTVKKAVPDAWKIKLHLERTCKGMELATYELAELLDNMMEHGHTEGKHQRAEELIDFLYGTMDGLESIGEELTALETATNKEKQIEAVKKIATTPPSRRGQIDIGTLVLAGVYDGRTKEQIIADEQEAQVPKNIGDIAVQV